MENTIFVKGTKINLAAVEALADSSLQFWIDDTNPCKLVKYVENKFFTFREGLEELAEEEFDDSLELIREIRKLFDDTMMDIIQTAASSNSQDLIEAVYNTMLELGFEIKRALSVEDLMNGTFKTIPVLTSEKELNRTINKVEFNPIILRYIDEDDRTKETCLMKGQALVNKYEG